MSIQRVKSSRYLQVVFGMVLALLGSAPVAFAYDYGNSATSIINWETEGNGRCSDYFSNAAVEEATANLSTGVAIGNFNPLDPDPDPLDITETRAYEDDEVINFTVSDDGTTVEQFTASTRINAVILKNSRDIAIFIEPHGGVWTSQDYKYAPPLDGTRITSMSFCYGVSYETPDLQLVDMPQCVADPTGTVDNSDADGCESGEAFECDFTLTGPASCNQETGENCTGVDVDCCSCGGPAVACNPNLPLGVEGACDNLAIKTFNQVLFGLNGKVICKMTDSGEICFKR